MLPQAQREEGRDQERKREREQRASVQEEGAYCPAHWPEVDSKGILGPSPGPSVLACIYYPDMAVEMIQLPGHILTMGEREELHREKEGKLQ